MKYAESLPGVSFDDIWNRLSDAEKHLCCARGGNSGWETFIAWAPREQYIAGRDSDINELKRFVREEQEKRRRVFGYLAYDLGLTLLNIQSRAKNDLKLPDILFYSFDAYVVCRASGVEIHTNADSTLAEFSKLLKSILARKPVEIRTGAHVASELASFAPKNEYASSFETVKSHIIDGDIYQMNLTHRLKGSTQKSARELWSALWEKNQSDFSAYIEADGFEILSASPERFISVSADRHIETFPIKGTRPRGKNDEEDQKLKHELESSEKETAELTMITDLLRNDIGKVCEFGSVRIVSPRIISAFASVWHAYSHITGTCAQGVRSIDALISMFPGGSVTGCPKKRAMEIIDESEPTARSVYAGSIGWIDPDDSADFNIAIRTLIKKGEKVYLQVGGGIVYDSVEKDEYQETLDKARSFLGVL
ncbi:MAG: anthranilate synthase component I family protein [bacterium]|nr:anthranilate synthase component I family protein [bacterium]